MIVAKKLSILQKNGYELNYTSLTQIYTIGNFITITGYRNDWNSIMTDKYIIEDLKSMTVSFDGKED